MYHKEYFPFGPRSNPQPNPDEFGYKPPCPPSHLPYPGWIPNHFVGNRHTVRLAWARDAEQLTGNRYYNAWDQKRIGIYPTPRSNLDVITIYYKKKPREILYTDDEIEVKDKFINILRYAVCMKLAMSGSNPDIDLYNVFASQYNTLLMEARRDKDSDHPYYQHVKDNARPANYYRRGPRGRWRGW